MLQDEQRVAALDICIVAWRRVDNCVAPLPDGPGEVPLIAYRPMRHIPERVIVSSRLGHFDCARFQSIANVSPAGGIVYPDTIEIEPVIMEAGHRGRRGDGPDAICSPGHIEGARAQSVAACGLGRARLRR